MNLLAPETIDFKTLPALPFEERSKLPNISCIYFVLDAEAAILYIGKSISLWQRFSFHEKLPNFQEASAVMITWLAIDEEDILPFIEEDCIAFFNPPLNKRNPQYRNYHAVAFWLDYLIYAKARYYMKKDGTELSLFISEQVAYYVQSVENGDRRKRQVLRAAETRRHQREMLGQLTFLSA